MGVPAQFSIWWSNLIAWGHQHTLQFYGKMFWNKAIAQTKLEQSDGTSEFDEVSEHFEGQLPTESCIERSEMQTRRSQY